MTSKYICHPTVDEFILCTCSNHTINDSLYSVQNTYVLYQYSNYQKDKTIPALCSRNKSTVHVMTSSNFQCTCTKNLGKKLRLSIYIPL